jgi:hypothetical protein
LRLVAVSLPIGVLLIYLGASGRLSSGRRAPEAVPAVQTIARAPAVVPAAVQSPAPAIDVPVNPTELTVAVLSTRPCWVSAVVDGEKGVERTLQAGEQQTFAVRRDLALTAGDAGALTWTINGADARALGRAGEKVTARVTLSNFKTFLAPR